MDQQVARLDYWPSPLSADGRRSILAREGARLSDLIAEVTPAGEDTMVLLNGAAVDPMIWDEVVLRMGDVVQARTVLHLGDGSNPIAAVLSIAVLLAAPALAALLPGAGIAGGAALGSLGGLTAGLTTFGHFAAAAIGVVGLVAVNNLFPPRLPGGRDPQADLDRLYTLTEGQNQRREFAPMLLLIGQHRMLPDYAAQPYTEFVSPNQVPDDYPEDVGFDFGFGFGLGLGNLQFSNVRVSDEGDQYLNELFDFGIGNLRISNERRGETLLAEYDDVATQVQQDSITLFAGNVDTIEGGELDRTATYQITRTTKGDTTKIAVDLASVHLTVNDDGDVIGRSNEFTVRYRTSGAMPGAWVSQTITIQSPSGNKARRGVRRSYEYGGLAAGTYDVEVTLNTAWPEGDDRRRGEAVLFAIRAFQDNEADFNGRNAYAVRTRASKQLSGRPPPFSADVVQLVPVWDGAQWVDAQATSNPAWHYRQFARGYYNDAGELMGGGGLALSQISDDEIKAWGAFCDANSLTCDLVISDGRKARETLDLIAQCGWGSYSKASGKVGVIWENDDQPVSAVFTPANIVAGSFRAQWNNQNLAEEVIGQYIDKESGYEQNSLRRTVSGITNPKRTITVPMEGITDGEQVAKELNRTVSAQTRHRRLMSWEVSAAGLLVTRGNVVGLAHGLVGGTLGGRFRSIDQARTGVRLSSDIAAAGHLWVWMQDGSVHSTTYSAAAYPSRDITLATALPALPAGIQDEASSYAFMTFADGAPTTEVRITAIEAAPGNKFRISVRDEKEAYYNDRVADLTHEIIAQPRSAGITELLVTDDVVEGNIVLQITPVGTGAFQGAVISVDGERVGVTRGPGETLTALSPVGTGEDVEVSATPGNEFATFGASISVTYTVVNEIPELAQVDPAIYPNPPYQQVRWISLNSGETWSPVNTQTQVIRFVGTEEVERLPVIVFLGTLVDVEEQLPGITLQTLVEELEELEAVSFVQMEEALEAMASVTYQQFVDAIETESITFVELDQALQMQGGVTFLALSIGLASLQPFTFATLEAALQDEGVSFDTLIEDLETVSGVSFDTLEADLQAMASVTYQQFVDAIEAQGVTFVELDQALQMQGGVTFLALSIGLASLQPFTFATLEAALQDEGVSFDTLIEDLEAAQGTRFAELSAAIEQQGLIATRIVSVQPQSQIPSGVTYEVVGDGTARAVVTLTHSPSGAQAVAVFEALSLDSIAITSDPRIEVDSDTKIVTEGSQVTVRVRLTQQPAADVTVVGLGSTGVDAVGDSALTFTPANYSSFQTLTYATRIDDDERDGRASILLVARYEGNAFVDQFKVKLILTDQGRLRVLIEQVIERGGNRYLGRYDEGTALTIRGKLSVRPSANVILAAAVEAAEVGRIPPRISIDDPATLTFTPDNWTPGNRGQCSSHPTTVITILTIRR